MDKEKFCPKCKTNKPAKDFPTSPNRRGGLGSWCLSCGRENGKRWYKNNKSTKDKQNIEWYYRNKRRARNAYLLRKYGITVEQYEDMFAFQGGVCAICKKSESAKDKSGTLRALAVDHCHDTGAIRGLLCYHCNQVIAHLGDNYQKSLRYFNYLKGGVA